MRRNPEINLLAVTQGRSAAAKVFDAIDRVPDIDSANLDGLKLDDVHGGLTLEGVKFSYPSGPSLQAVKG
jgi:ATP-binding cassette subfamily B (MDR/TAP) protein 1